MAALFVITITRISPLVVTVVLTAASSSPAATWMALATTKVSLVTA